MKTKKAAVQPAAGTNEFQGITYLQAAPTSSENLKDEIGLLLWFLCSPISRRQRVAGWRLLEALYGHYVSVRAWGAKNDCGL